MVCHELTGIIKLTCSQEATCYFTVPSLFQFHAECELGAELVLPSGMHYFIETSVRNKCRCTFYCALLTLHVSAPISGHLQVVCNTKNSKAVAVYVNGSVASVC
jgi:hypothetical protein